MKISFKAENKRDVVIHFLLVVCIGLILLLGFFYIYLPFTTNHNQTVTVPNLMGMSISEVETYLAERDLDYVIEDSVYKPDAKPLTVSAQFPYADGKVKKGRKIFISIYSLKPPIVKMPKLVGRSLVNAQTELENAGLRLGKVDYEPDIQQNAVLKQIFNGQPIAEGIDIPKGSKVDLVVADGLGQQEFDVPDLKGLTYEEADINVAGAGLQFGVIIYDPNATDTPGTIIKQKPEPGNKIRAGSVIDVWVSGPDPKAGAEPIEPAN